MKKHKWAQLSTGDEAFDFGITYCERCGKDWRFNKLPCRVDTCRNCGETKANHDLHYDEILCEQFIETKQNG